MQIPTPSNLYVTVIHPQIEIKTSEARAILPKEIELKKAISQWANVGSLVHALHTNDYQLIKRSLEDVIVEPHRSKLIPFFNDVKLAANTYALGTGISGSGPSIFALTEGIENAKKVEQAIRNVYSKTDIAFETYVSKINVQGMKILS